MHLAKQKKIRDNDFKIIIVKIDDFHLNDEWLEKYLYLDWNKSYEQDSIIHLLEALTNHKYLLAIESSAVLSSVPSKLFSNDSNSIREHTKNYALYYFAHIKSLLSSMLCVGRPEEYKDTLKKIIDLDLLQKLPFIHGGAIMIKPGVYECIYTRMRCIPNINIFGLPEKYTYKVISINEISCRIKFVEKSTGKQINYAVPFNVDFNAEL